MRTAASASKGEIATPPPVLRDPVLEAALCADGYVVLPGVARREVAWLRGLAVESFGGDDRHDEVLDDPRREGWEGQGAPGDTWKIGVNDASQEQRDAYEQQLADWWHELLERHLHHHSLLFTSFLAKHPGDDSTLPMHQDPSVVDERLHRSVTFWVALDDMGPDLANGELHVLPGSHLVGSEWRGTFTSSTYLSEVERLWREATSLPVRAGDAVVLDSRVVHGSPPNFGTSSRLAMAGTVVPTGVPLQHVLGRDDGTDEVLIQRVDRAFFQRVSPRSLHVDPPRGLEVVEVLPRASVPIEADALVQAARRRRRPWARWRSRRAG